MVAYHRQLLEQAHHLSKREPKKPQQASLRRAVSAAYYALFHFLTERASAVFMGGSPRDRDLRGIVIRCFGHSEMAAASKGFMHGTLKKPFDAALGGHPIDPVMRSIAEAFVDLQEARHKADYDLSRPLLRQDVVELVQQAEDAITLWATTSNGSQTRLYLMALLLWNRPRG